MTNIDPNLSALITDVVLKQLQQKPKDDPTSVSKIDKALGGKTNWKTATGLVGAIITYALHWTDALPGYQPYVEVAFTLFSSLLGVGVVSKAERVLEAVRVIAKALEVTSEVSLKAIRRGEEPTL